MSQATDELVSLVDDRYEQASKAQQRVVEEMEQARLFYRGDQWLRRDHNKWITAPSPRWRVRLTVNKLPPLVELSIATFLRYKPIITTTPATSDEDDRRTAKVSELLARYLWDELKTNVLLVEMLTWMFTAGSAFVRTGWDDKKGRKIPIFAQVPSMNPETGIIEAVDSEEIVDYKYDGLPTMDIIDPFSMSVEPGALKFEDAAWCIATEILRIGELEKRFNTKIEPTSANDDQIHTPMYVERDSQIINEDRAALMQMYERPTKKHPNGRLIFKANNKILDEQELPGGQIRIVHFRNIILPGEFWPTSMCSQVIPLQMEINRGRSQLIENRNLTSRPQMISPEGAIVKGTYNNKPGSIVQWDPIAAHSVEPHYLNPPQVPGFVMAILGLANEDMMDLTSRHEASQGQNTGASSGRQVAMYRSADDSRLAPTMLLFEEGLQEVGKHQLATCQENMNGEMVLNIVGKGRISEVFKFNANDVSDATNLRYDIGSQLPWAKESTREMAMQLNASGKMSDEMMHQILEVPDDRKLYENEQSHRLNARLENQQLVQGYFAPLPTDNHQVHLQEHEHDINLPENRQRLISEMQGAVQRAKMMGEEPPKVPPSIQFKLQHMEAHRKSIPAPQPPPPAPKVNLSLDRLLQNEALMANPKLMAKVLPMVLDIAKDATGAPATPSNTPPKAGGARAPGTNMPEAPSAPSGSSAEMSATTSNPDTSQVMGAHPGS